MAFPDPMWEMGIFVVLLASLLSLRRIPRLTLHRASKALPRRTFNEIKNHLSDRAFRDCFGLIRSSFNFLLDVDWRIIWKYTDLQEEKKKESHPIVLENVLKPTLYWLLKFAYWGRKLARYSFSIRYWFPNGPYLPECCCWFHFKPSWFLLHYQHGTEITKLFVKVCNL